MRLLAPTPTPYDPLEWVEQDFEPRARAVCDAWALQGYGAPVAVYVAYALKVLVYVAGWAFFCGFSPALGGVSTIASWWLHPIAFQKMVVFSLAFEVLGLGCGSGPLTGRYVPPLGGVLYFLRPGTTKLPLFPGAPLIGRDTRGVVDVLLYAALLVVLGRALVSPEPGFAEFLPIAVLVPVLGVLDKTVFLAARAEHYWVTVVCFAFAANWLPGAQAVQLALWTFAGVSKLNHHFPTVVAVMNSNSPFTRVAWWRKAMYRRYPDDLRPSRLATWLGHGVGAGRAPGVRAHAAGDAAARRHRADARAAHVHHEQRADGRAARVERGGGVRRLRALLGAPGHVAAGAGARLGGGLRLRQRARVAGVGEREAGAHLVPVGDAVLRGELGVLGVARAEGRGAEAGAADEVERVDLRPALALLRPADGGGHGGQGDGVPLDAPARALSAAPGAARGGAAAGLRVAGRRAGGGHGAGVELR